MRAHVIDERTIVGSETQTDKILSINPSTSIKLILLHMIQKSIYELRDSTRHCYFTVKLNMFVFRSKSKKIEHCKMFFFIEAVIKLVFFILHNGYLLEN